MLKCQYVRVAVFVSELLVSLEHFLLELGVFALAQELEFHVDID